MKKAKAAPAIYRLRVTLRWIDPPIWRLIDVPGDVSLEKLHRIIQAAMGWENSHLYGFRLGRTDFGGAPDFDLGAFIDLASSGLGPKARPRSPRNAILSDVAPARGKSFLYEYDFGDSWEHDVWVEEIRTGEGSPSHPVCLAGERACPPEDCGGVPGYEDLLAAIRDPEHPDHEDLVEWVGSAFDPEAFDLDAVNLRLRRFR